LDIQLRPTGRVSFAANFEGCPRFGVLGGPAFRSLHWLTKGAERNDSAEETRQELFASHPDVCSDIVEDRGERSDTKRLMPRMVMWCSPGVVAVRRMWLPV
jgi:hypothetical protein